MSELQWIVIRGFLISFVISVVFWILTSRPKRSREPADGGGLGVKLSLTLYDVDLGDPLSMRVGEDIVVCNWRVPTAGRVCLYGKFGDLLGVWDVPVGCCGLMKVTVRHIDEDETVVSELSAVHSEWVGPMRTVSAVYRAVGRDGKVVDLGS